MLKHSVSVSAAALMLAVSSAVTNVETAADNANWPMFRGLTAGAVEDDPMLPESWSATENVAWKVDVPGLGWSSPVVWGDYVFVTSAISAGKEAPPAPGLDLSDGQTYALGNYKDPSSTVERRWMLYAYDFKTGKLRWERQLHRGVPLEAKHLKNTFASETPVTDGKTIYVYVGNAHMLFAVDFSGKVIWSSEITQHEVTPAEIEAYIKTHPKPRTPSGGELMNMGAAASPALHDGRIYIQNDHHGPPTGIADVGEWFLVAVDARTGKEIWRVREEKADENGFSSPYVWANRVRTEVVVMGNWKIRAFSTDGKLLWTIDKPSGASTPTPFAANDLLYVGHGQPNNPFRPIYAIRPGASGDITVHEGEPANEHVAWFRRQLGPYMPSPLAYKGVLYNLHSNGLVTANDAITGETVYGRRRIATDAGTFTASPWGYNGKIFALSEDGDTYVIQAGPEFKVLGKNSLGQMALATPAVVRGSVILRTATSLWRIARTSH